MRVAVKLFAAGRELAGAAVLAVDLPESATVADVRQALAAACPALGPLAPRCLLAVNAQYAADGAVVAPGDEVALIPPVSGG
ncbi:MAG TPA: MoaD/ThiS family protein [Lacipirellulaceae bacterium]|nr:MoaD/ThiS family protein [Lacipirellulaceae bacterium]